MHNALRAHENPALDVAITLARQNGLPLLVYHGLSENYPFASDRHHAFIMQGARHVQREMNALGIAYAFHLERVGHRGPHLRDLARRAAVVVTEAMPVTPLLQWTQRLRHVTNTPLVSVDTSCLVPMSQIAQLVADRSTPSADARMPLQSLAPWVTQASRYRELTADAYRQRLDADDWQLEHEHLGSSELPERYEGPFGFEPLDLQDICLSQLIGQCKIDHTIAAVPDSPGGSRVGYARWDDFRQRGLAEYDLRRRDAADPLGGSRISAYLHYGMVSPFRIAREAAQLQDEHPAAVKKFLDEFLVWREMSFHFCDLHSEQLDTLDACPSWAVDSLRKHGHDARTKTYDWETLSRGRTSHPLFDAAQRSLLRHGELHNDLRMTWGKAFLPFTACPEQALNFCIDLNHRYALDGRSTASYGGILWCFGQFDHPFPSESPVFGLVRGRSLQTHAERLSVKRFSIRSDRPIAAYLPRVAVIGAGIGGLMAARTLTDHGLEVRVFDKSRGVGGRLATRRNPNAMSFDHGAQYFTVRDDRFARYVRSWISQGQAAAWMGRIVELRPGGEVVSEKRTPPRYVGVPAMNSIAKHLAADLNVSLGVQVSKLVHEQDNVWELMTAENESLGSFDAVIMNCPPLQTLSLLQGHTDLVEQVAAVEMVPCWTLMLICDNLNDLPFAGAFINDGPLRWIARNDDKPDRTKPVNANQSSWVLQASAEWSREHLEDDVDDVREHLLDALQHAVGKPLGDVHHAVTHRWRYANTNTALPQSHLWDPAAMLGVCGDWCGGPRVEGAFLSGAAVAGAVLRHVTIDRPSVELQRAPIQQCFFD
jgi:predicted NAD/FAD-dependent oxidoreductase/deoxyribodipyrimidine photolyase